MIFYRFRFTMSSCVWAGKEKKPRPPPRLMLFVVEARTNRKNQDTEIAHKYLNTPELVIDYYVNQILSVTCISSEEH